MNSEKADEASPLSTLSEPMSSDSVPPCSAEPQKNPDVQSTLATIEGDLYK